MNRALTRFAPLLGRVLIGQVFFLSGVNKLLDPARTIALIASHGVPFPAFCCFAAAAVEIGGSLALILGIKIRWSALVLAAFVVVVTTIFHWNFAIGMNAQLFRKDVAIAGGLLLAAYFGSDRRASIRTRAGKTPHGECRSTPS